MRLVKEVTEASRELIRLFVKESAVKEVSQVPEKVVSSFEFKLSVVTAPSPDVPIKVIRALELRFSVAREGDEV